MFLVTTADERTWKKDEKILFLGEWCKLYKRRHVWQKLDYEMLPYHWDDRTKLFTDFQYLTRIYERYLPLLAERLNEMHGCDHSLRYWRIVIGPWLRYFMDILMDRYLSMKAAASHEDIAITWMMNSQPMEWIPRDMNRFTQYFCSDAWNHFIYGEIIKQQGDIPYEVMDVRNDPLKFHDEILHRPWWKAGLKTLLDCYAQMIPGRFNRTVFVSSYCNLSDLSKLQLALGQLPYPRAPEVSVPDTAAMPGLREKLKLSGATNEFEQILGNMIPRQMPLVHVEAYQELRARALHYFPVQPRLIYTAVAHASDEAFKLWAAEKVEQGAKLLIAQHGGHYGTGLWEQTEDHQIAIADKYYSWGWKRNGEDKTRPIPAMKLSSEIKSLRSPLEGSALLVLTSIPRYSYRMFSVPVAPQVREYLYDQISFIKHLSVAARGRLRVRIYDGYDFGWDVKLRLKDAGFGNMIDEHHKGFIERLNECSLCISTTNGTTFLETLAANYPTLIFWNPGHWELRSDAHPYFDELRNVGILHDTPQSAATKLNEIHQDVQSWWRQREVQDARNIFCSQFALTSDHWLEEWKQELREMT